MSKDKELDLDELAQALAAGADNTLLQNSLSYLHKLIAAIPLLIARVRHLEKDQTFAESIANLDEWNGEVDRLNSKLEAMTAQVVELEQMCKVANEYGDAALSDYNRELLRVEAWREAAEESEYEPCHYPEGTISEEVAALFKKARALDSTEDASETEGDNQ